MGVETGSDSDDELAGGTFEAGVACAGTDFASDISLSGSNDELVGGSFSARIAPARTNFVSDISLPGEEGAALGDESALDD